jgi:glycosyltransferase involved in cell wall biosynthesis
MMRKNGGNMKRKKELLFVIDSLDVAGAEKSLVTLLRMLNYEIYSVDLMLFGHGGLLEALLPPEVNLLEPLKYTGFSRLNLKDSLLYSLQKFDIKMLRARLKYSTEIRKKRYSNPQKARVFWEGVASVIEENTKEYDIAISYAQGVPTFYVAEKVMAKKKYAWVNTSLKLDEKEAGFQSQFYDCFDAIVAVSDSAKTIFLETFPDYSYMIRVIYDINNPDFISDLAEVGESYNDNFNGVRMLTIGRLSAGKGYDIALDVCKLLKENGVEFRWYVLGKGPLEQDIKCYIKENNLEEYFILLGVKSNPYPFIKDADLYVQTSRFEGFGLAIAEARMLNIPVVTTRFDSVYNQMINEKNGLVVDMKAEAVYEGILKLMEDDQLYHSICEYLKKEKKGNVEEIEKVYQLIG